MSDKVFSKNDLIAFLYLLMRDAASTGEIVRIARMLNVGGNNENVYTSPELEAYAKRLANEILT